MTTRRRLLGLAALPWTGRRLTSPFAATAAAASLPALAQVATPAQAQSAGLERRYQPTPGVWRTFDLTTRVEVAEASGATRVWLPLPSIDGDYQRSLASGWSGNATTARLLSDQRYGARMLLADFAPGGPSPVVELTSRVQTRDRAVDWSRPARAGEDAATLRRWLEATELMPTDGIVLDTAREAIGDARDDTTKARRIFDWVVDHTYREPKIRGCGVGDVKTMLETGDFGGKCGDINGLFVALNRAVGIPARDVYGIRVAPSSFGYRELGGNPARLQGAQHCRAEVFLRDHGWVAMDPADVGKVMRQESPTWIKDVRDPLVAPVHRALFGAWEGNWLGFNAAHDVALPGSTGSRLGFFMYPQAENVHGRYDPLDADRFRYTISAREVVA